ncbi:hypothetical protein AYI70_g1981 [Smittium culicis]|uniref:Uncharacterized protein n=1 Tax=Smittium culicis TaxID=133412 RepID=A0A1R1YA78_9FUNG|nr:hypothetical protein AYI70_g1981 [Smittium culicis]
MIISFFAITKTSGYWGLTMIPLLVCSFMYLFVYCNKVNSNFEFIPTYLWRHPPPSDSYPLPPSSGKDNGNGNGNGNGNLGKDMEDIQKFEKKSEDTLQKHNSYTSLKGGEGVKNNNIIGMEKLNLPNINSYNISSVFSPYGFLFDADTNKINGMGRKKRSKLRHYESESPIKFSDRHFVDADIRNAREKVGDDNNLNVFFFNQNVHLGESVFRDPKYGYMENWISNKEKLDRNKTLVGANKKGDLKKLKAKRVKSRILIDQNTREIAMRKNSESVVSHKINKTSIGNNRGNEAQINNSLGLRKENGAKKYIKSSSPAIGYHSSVMNESSYSDSKFKAVKSLNSMQDSDTDAVAKASGVLVPRNKNELGTGKLRKRGIRKNGRYEYGSVEHKNMEVMEYKNYMGAVSRKNPLYDGKLGDGIRSKSRIAGVDGNVQLDDLHVEEIKLIENMILVEEGGGLYSRSNSTYSLRDSSKKNGIDTVKSKGSKLENILDNSGYKNVKNENIRANKNSEKHSTSSLKKFFGYKNSGNKVLSSNSVSNTSFYSSDNASSFDSSKKGLAIRLNTENSFNSLYSGSSYTNSTASLNSIRGGMNNSTNENKYVSSLYKSERYVPSNLNGYGEYFSWYSSEAERGITIPTVPNIARINKDKHTSLPNVLTRNGMKSFSNYAQINGEDQYLWYEEKRAIQFMKRKNSSNISLYGSMVSNSVSVAASLYGSEVNNSMLDDSQLTKIAKAKMSEISSTTEFSRTAMSERGNGSANGDRSFESKNVVAAIMTKIKQAVEGMHDSANEFLFSDFNPAAAILDGSIDILFSNTAEQRVDYDLHFDSITKRDDKCKLDLNYDDLSLSYFDIEERSARQNVGRRIGNIVNKVLKRKRVSNENILSSMSNSDSGNSINGSSNGSSSNVTRNNEVSARLGESHSIEIGKSSSGGTIEIASQLNEDNGRTYPRFAETEQEYLKSEKTEVSVDGSESILGVGTEFGGRSRGIPGSMFKYEFGLTATEKREKVKNFVNHGDNGRMIGGDRSSPKKSKNDLRESHQPRNNDGKGKDDIGYALADTRVSRCDSGAKRSPLSKNSNYDYFSKNINSKRMTRYKPSLQSLFRLSGLRYQPGADTDCEKGHCSDPNCASNNLESRSHAIEDHIASPTKLIADHAYANNTGQDVLKLKGENAGDKFSKVIVARGTKSPSINSSIVKNSANYQRFSAEAQHELLPNKHCDYIEPPMLRVPGILDGSVNDYVHPGLYGKLPELWLPVKSD